MSSPTSPGLGRLTCTILLVFVGAAIVGVLFFLSVSSKQTITYKDKSLDAWFHGSRRDFFTERTRQAAQDAIDSVGTNGFPFLLSKLKESRGNVALYFKLYRAMPAWLQMKLPYPISGDDIKAIALMDHLPKLRDITSEQVQSVADCVPDFANPRLRMAGFGFMLQKHQVDPVFLKLCRKLLNDSNPGIQLRGAIYLAQSALTSDPGDARLFPVLLTAMESKAQRKLSLDLSNYMYRQQPPGSGSPPNPGLPHFDPDAGLLIEIRRAMDRLEPYLSEEQRKLLKKTEVTQREDAGNGQPQQN